MLRNNLTLMFYLFPVLILIGISSHENFLPLCCIFSETVLQALWGTLFHSCLYSWNDCFHDTLYIPACIHWQIVFMKHCTFLLKCGVAFLFRNIFTLFVYLCERQFCTTFPIHCGTPACIHGIILFKMNCKYLSLTGV